MPRILIVDDDPAIREVVHGPGLSPANAARAFDPLFITAQDRGGTGLGLAISRALVEGAGGSIALLPSATGATFRIVLPRAT
jgi:signal transduction histidine kinase